MESKNLCLVATANMDKGEKRFKGNKEEDLED